MRIAVVGVGHVGLVTCVTMASMGHDIVGVDSDTEKIAFLEQRRAPFFEPGLQELLVQELDSGRLHFVHRVEDAVRGAEVIFISVGTPPRISGEANMIAVETAAVEAARAARGRTIIVEKSTVPAGTSIQLRRAIRRTRPDLGLEIEVASNPEFLREGSAIQDALTPERILVGAEKEWVFEVMRQVYEPLVAKGIRLIETDIQTAEIAKHASNSFLATKISFANALAEICERAGADVVSVAEIMGLDPRIGRAFLDAGIGFGGSCFPKDLRAFDHLANTLGYDFALLREVQRINEQAVESVHRKVKDALWNLEGKRIALLGLAFKPQTDDIRFAPALVLAQRLLAEGASVVGWDPEASESAKSQIPQLETDTHIYSALREAECAIVCTEWPEVKELDLNRVKETMAYPVVIDGRNTFDPDVMAAMGFTYYPTGRPPVT